MFRRLFAIETAAIRTIVEQGGYRQETPYPAQIDGFRSLAGLGSSPFGSGLWSRRSAA